MEELEPLKESIKIHSDAWPVEEMKSISTTQDEEKLYLPNAINSNIHVYLAETKAKIDLNKVYYRELEEKDLIEIENLHNEWFPIRYGPEYFKSVTKYESVIGIGCFSISSTKAHQFLSRISESKRDTETLEKENGPRHRSSSEEIEERKSNNTRQKTEKKEKQVQIEHCLGAILVRMEYNEGVCDLINKRTAFQIFSHRFKQTLCFCTHPREMVAYIMTLGVIDEMRRFGIGTKLLKQAQYLVQNKFPMCKALALHVVEYNRSAIRFYERNEFLFLKMLSKYYHIRGKEYTALLLALPLKNEKNQLRKITCESKNENIVNKKKKAKKSKTKWKNKNKKRNHFV